MFNEGKTTIVAEMAQSYEGSSEVASEMASRVCKSGVDAVLFQIVFADELAVPKNINYKLFKSLELPDGAWKQVIQTIHDNDGLAIGEVFGKRSVDTAVEGGVDGFKIHIADIGNIPLLKYIGSLEYPIMLSIGGASESEIRTAVGAFSETSKKNLVLMFGFQKCPTPLQDTHILKIPAVSEMFNLPVGYSDHIAGYIENNFNKVNPFAFQAHLLALGAGAKVIEKHVIPNRDREWEDSESALTPEEFVEFVSQLRSLETALGERSFELTPPERSYGVTHKKYIVASKDMEAGTIIDETHISFKRIASGDYGTSILLDIIGKKLIQSVRFNDTIHVDNITTKE